MKLTMLSIYALSAVAIYAEAPLKSPAVKQGSIEVSAVALPGPKKKVGLMIVNSGDADVQVEGRVVASSSKKTAPIADCRFTTSAPAKSDAKKKITCDTTGADKLEVVITSGTSQ